MKVFFWFTFLILTVYSCKQKPKKQDSAEQVQKQAEPVTTNPLKTYADFIKTLDTTKVTSVSSAATKFDEVFANADTVKADSGFVLFHHLYTSVESYLNEEHIKDPTDYTAYVSENSSPKSAKTAKADEHIKKLRQNGFTIDISEGQTYIKQERDFLIKYFYPRVSTAMKEYLVQVNIENKQGLTEDAALKITPIELGNRILFWEDFIKRNPSFVFIQDIKEKQKGNITFLLEGIDNSPLFEAGSYKLRNEYAEAFKNIIQNKPESTTAALVKPYYLALQHQDRKAARRLLQQYKKQGVIYDYSS